jgi:hypothetical protein
MCPKGAITTFFIDSSPVLRTCLGRSFHSVIPGHVVAPFLAENPIVATTYLLNDIMIVCNLKPGHQLTVCSDAGCEIKTNSL